MNESQLIYPKEPGLTKNMGANTLSHHGGAPQLYYNVPFLILFTEQTKGVAKSSTATIDLN